VPIDRWAAGDYGQAGPPVAGESPGRRSVRDILELFVRVCDAVHHAHQRGVIHRDLKPSNILVGTDGAPHVLDFGLAKLHAGKGDATLTQTGNFVGTPAYAAPEQLIAQHDDIDVRSDVYALGAILYEALSGGRLFQEVENFAGLIEAVQHVEPPSLSTINPDIPRDLAAIVMKAIEKEKDRRYGSVHALAEDVQRFLDGQAVLAHAPSAVYRCRKFLRKNATLASVTGLALVAVLTLGVVSTVQAAREHGLRTAADEARGAAEREARLQRETADALSGIIERIASHAANRRSIETSTLTPWLVEPLDKGDLSLRPDVLVQLHRGIAELYASTRKYEDALHHNASALELTQQLGQNDVRCHLLLRRTFAFTHMRRFPEAEQTAREAMVLAEQIDGRLSERVALAYIGLFYVYKGQGRLEEAEAAIQEAINVRSRVHSSMGPVTEARGFLVDLWIAGGQYDRAVSLLTESLAALRTSGEHRSKYAMWVLARLGGVHFRLGHLAESEARLSELADLRLKHNGLKYARTSSDLQLHAWVLHALGRYDETVERLEQALVFQEHEAKSPKQVARIRFEMATAMFADGREEEARRQLLRAVSLGKAIAPGDAKWDARVAEMEAAIRAHDCRYDERLGPLLSDFEWLMSERNRFGEPGSINNDAPLDTNTAESTDAGQPPQ
jgi:tetratricopeptide (TPR) repeat protein